MEIKVHIDGMMCGQCEAHVNDAFRRKLNPRKVHSSASRKCTVLEVDEDIDDEAIIAALDNTGYRVLSIKRGEAKQKKGLFSFFRKK